MSHLRGTLWLRDGHTRAPEARESLSGGWTLDLGGEAGSALPDVTVFGTAGELREIAEAILAAVPSPEPEVGCDDPAGCICDDGGERALCPEHGALVPDTDLTPRHDYFRDDFEAVQP